jgi:hypothetical protein
VQYCIYCSGCDLALHDELISKAFTGRRGRAWLFNSIINVQHGESQDRQLTTGLHTVSDISCNNCESCIGWYYNEAHELSQKYKEGKYIVEKMAMIAETFQ